MIINSLKGTKDIFGPEADLWHRLEEIARQIFAFYAYSEIRTPLIEHTSLFARSIGKTTDIVQKEMYSFKDKGHRDITLRPEETASVVRAYIQHGIFRQKGTAKFYYMGPMFRSERPQAGRMRQFHQIGVEAIGAKNPLLDAEIIILLNEILSTAGVKNYIFKLNSLGCMADRKKYKETLKKALKPHLNDLCPDCVKRYELNILRVLDCKNKHCRGIISKLPIMPDYWCEVCRKDFEQVVRLLDEFNVPKNIDSHLVRGLDYYTGITFEVIAEGLGAQDAVAAGGRYDDLILQLEGPDTGACGFAIGVERLISSISDPDSLRAGKIPFVYLVSVGEETFVEAFRIISVLRENKICAQMDYTMSSLKSQMRCADTLGADYVIIIGEDEMKSDTLTVKDMKKGGQQKISRDKLPEFLSGIKRKNE